MNNKIQPKVHTDCTVICACGNKFTTISTLPQIKVDICSSCHPFYTGQQKFVDTEGRIDKFNKKAKIMQEKAKKHSAIKAKKAKEAAESSNSNNTPEPTLKELFSKDK